MSSATPSLLLLKAGVSTNCIFKYRIAVCTVHAWWGFSQKWTSLVGSLLRRQRRDIGLEVVWFDRSTLAHSPPVILYFLTLSLILYWTNKFFATLTHQKVLHLPKDFGDFQFSSHLLTGDTFQGFAQNPRKKRHATWQPLAHLSKEFRANPWICWSIERKRLKLKENRPFISNL
jgi:hypothetical protein